jgi:lactoylglutathione lyase
MQESNKIPHYFNFSQNMLRIKDPSKSIPFYEALGMTVAHKRHFSNFRRYFLASSSSVDLPIDYASLSHNEATEALMAMFGPVLELTHNHVTENDNDFKNVNGNKKWTTRVSSHWIFG